MNNNIINKDRLAQLMHPIREGEYSIGIISENNEISFEFADRLIGNISIKDIKFFGKYFDNCYRLKAFDNTIYSIVPLNEVSRGMRFDKVYVHEDIDNDFKEAIIPIISLNTIYFKL